MTIRKEFESHRLNEEGLKKLDKIRESFSALLDTIEKEAEGADPRLLAIVRTELERTSLFVNKAVASVKANQA